MLYCNLLQEFRPSILGSVFFNKKGPLQSSRRLFFTFWWALGHKLREMLLYICFFFVAQGEIMAPTLIRAFDHLMKSLRQYCKGKQENVLYRYVASKKKGSCPSARGQRTKKNAHPHWKGARAGGSLFGNFSMTRLGDCLRIRISWHQASSYLLFF